ncbi:glycosyltransferase family 2 protein [Ktedonobacteria bacterium brp13]|nr:glycosyltransferase family 2 protein [Ktedonobacteria bacterium brp13]
MASPEPGLLAMSAADKGSALHVGLLTKTTTKEAVEQPFRESEEGATQGERTVPESAQHTYSLSVVLPAYNEAAVIEKTVSLVVAALTQWTSNFEVVVVNDGSRDHTREIVEQMQITDACIRLINHPVNKGYGAALISGFHAVSKELVFFMDSDGQFDINDLQSLFPLIEQYDAVFGYRNPRRDSWLRKLNAWGWKQLVRCVVGVQVRDIDCAFKLYRADFFQTLKLETGGAMINAEMLYKFKRAGLRYAEVGVRHFPREEGEATGARPAVIIRAIRELFVYAWKWRQEERL